MFKTGTKDDISTMRSEYTRMRDTAQKRIKRLQEQFPESKAFQNHANGFPKLKDIDPRDFPKAFSELAKFVKAKSSSVTGQKEIKNKTMKTWQDQGLNLNPKNYDKVIKILEELRRAKLTYGSDKVVQLADIILYLDDQQTNDWLNHLEQLLPHLDEVQTLVQSGYIPADFEELRQMTGW